jgi:signal transduction histidine kinase
VIIFIAAPSGTRRLWHAKKRARAIAFVFVAVQLLVVLFGVLGLEGINILRSYAAGEAHWSKGQKEAVFALHRYARSRDPADYAQFEHGMLAIEGDRVARETLEHVKGFGTRDERARAAQGFVLAGNDVEDAEGLVWGFLLFHRWPTFKAAVSEWAQGDTWAAQLRATGRRMHAAAAHGATPEQLKADLAQVKALDAHLSRNAAVYAKHMAEASRIAKELMMALFVFFSGLACAIGVLLIRRITSAGGRAEARAIESEERVRDFAELASDWFCELDKDLRVKLIASRLTGDVGRDRVIGEEWIEAGRAEGFRPLIEGEHAQALAARQAFRGHRFSQTLPDGRELHWSVSGKPLFAPDGTFAGFRVTGTEIGDMVRAQEELVRARDEAMRANKAKSAFLANMSHELRTPLNAILGFSTFIEHQALGEIANKRYIEYAGDIRESGEHLLEIINDLLEHSRIEAGKIELREERFDIGLACEQARMFCEPRAEKAGIRLRTLIAPDLPPIYGDELRLRQVLVNLVSNAVKFTPNGSVDIVARVDGAGALRLDVRDTGIGMDAAGIEQALKPFGQVDNGLSRKFEGTGLGLPLAKSLVELHGGTLSIVSEQGVGTVVSVVLPAWRVGGNANVQAAE